MAHILNILRQKGASNSRKEEEGEPGSTDTVPEEKLREKDVVSV